jgi:hypothetical protein
MKIEQGNPAYPLISCGTAIFEELILDATSGVSCSGCASAIDTIQTQSPEEMDCDTLINTWLYPLFRITNITVGCLILIFECIGDTLSSLLRCVFCGESIDEIPAAALDATRALSVNRSRLGDLPLPINSSILDSDDLHAEISFDEFLSLFDSIFKDRKTEFLVTEARGKLDAYIKIVKTGLTPEARIIGRVPSQIFTDNLQRIAKLLIVELRKPEISNDKKQQALLEIAESSYYCEPRLFEESQRQWLRITNQEISLEEKLKAWLQMLKEDIILEQYQEEHSFHILNHARKHLPDWGLDQNPVNFEDQYMEGSACGVFEVNYRYTLNKEYTPARIVDAIREKIIFDDNIAQINQFFSDHTDAIQADYLNVEDFFEIDPQTTKSHITHQAVGWLLKKNNFLY